MEDLEWVTNEWEAPYTNDPWRRQFIEGDPMPTKTFSVLQLKGMGLVGLYRKKAGKPIKEARLAADVYILPTQEDILEAEAMTKASPE